MQHIRLLDVGQCGFDGPRMTRLFREELDARVDNADDLDETRQKLSKGKYDLVLVNRLLAMDGSSGLEVIKALTSAGCECPVMLVSDKGDAQEQAVKLGAVRGFGKSELEEPATLELIRKCAGKA